MKAKLKNSKSVLKRFRVSPKGKLQHRHVRIDHFNAKVGGDTRRHKRSQKSLVGQDGKDIKKMMPYLSVTPQIECLE